MELVLWPSPVLSSKTEEVSVFDQELQETVDKMFEVMQHHNGIGLAGPQVGLLKRLFVMQLKHGRREAVINPGNWMPSSQNQVEVEEGCLSFPGIRIKVRRYHDIVVSYKDVRGSGVSAAFSGIDAICFQHEFDHLNGKTFLEYLSRFKRGMIERRFTGGS